MKTARRSAGKRVYPRIYDQAVQDALIPLREAFNCQCGKLSAPFLHADIDGTASRSAAAREVRLKLHKISAAVIGRLLNYFYPCRKLVSKERAGSKAGKTYDKPQTPFDRALPDNGLPKEIKDRLITEKAAVVLMDGMAAVQKAALWPFTQFI